MDVKLNVCERNTFFLCACKEIAYLIRDQIYDIEMRYFARGTRNLLFCDKGKTLWNSNEEDLNSICKQALFM